MRWALANCVVYTGEEVRHDSAVVIDGGLIEDVVPAGGLSSDLERVDCGGQSVAPGFIDLQVNGGGDLLFNDAPSVETIRTIVSAHRQFGTTAMLPTFITGPEAGMEQAIEAVRTCLEAREPGVLGIHLEGPFLNPAKPGVHPPEFIREMGESDLSAMPNFENGVSLVTVAPERVSAEILTELVRRVTRVSGGHTNATNAEMKEAFARGVSCTTHLFNAMRALQSREPGVVGAALADPDSWCGIIVDGHHVDFDAVRVAWQAKARRKLFLVTDAMSPVGGRQTEFVLGPHRVTVLGGRCQTDNGILAGAVLDMASAVRNCVQHVGIPAEEALRMASTYPAEFIGASGRLGLIRAGHQADLVVFDDQINVSQVVVGGTRFPARPGSGPTDPTCGAGSA